MEELLRLLLVLSTSRCEGWTKNWDVGIRAQEGETTETEGGRADSRARWGTLVYSANVQDWS